MMTLADTGTCWNGECGSPRTTRKTYWARVPVIVATQRLLRIAHARQKPRFQFGDTYVGMISPEDQARPKLDDASMGPDVRIASSSLSVRGMGPDYCGSSAAAVGVRGDTGPGNLLCQLRHLARDPWEGFTTLAKSIPLARQ
jgi:hypothetical protein